MMDANELREKVRLAINQSRIDNDRVADTAAIAIRIVAEACAQIVRERMDGGMSEMAGSILFGDMLVDDILALIPKEPNNVG